jgi:hypothetical protein
MAQIPNFSLGGTNIPMPNNAGVNTQGVLGGAGLALQQQQQAIQAAQFQQQLAQQQQQAQQQARIEQGKALAQNALAAYDAYGDAAGPESFNAFKAGMNMLAPGSVDPQAQWDNTMGDALSTANDAFSAASEGKRPWPEAIGVISKTMSQASQQQRARMQPILQSAQDQFNQQQSTQRQQSSQTQDTQRAYGEHVQPLLQRGAMLNTVDQLLAQKTPTADAEAKTYIDGALANGTISQAELDKMTTAGGPFAQLKTKWQNYKTGLTFDQDHRQAMQSWISAKRSEINNTLQATATSFPGAKPASIQPVTKVVNGVTYINQGGQWYPQQ